jgi:hypothetical protein
MWKCGECENVKIPLNYDEHNKFENEELINFIFHSTFIICKRKI